MVFGCLERCMIVSWGGGRVTSGEKLGYSGAFSKTFGRIHSKPHIYGSQW